MDIFGVGERDFAMIRVGVCLTCTYIGAFDDNYIYGYIGI